MENLFFAVVPDRGANVRMSAILDEHGEGFDPSARRVPVDSRHVSVQSLGEYELVPDPLIAQARRMGGRVEVPPFDVAFDRLMGFSADKGHSVVLAGASAEGGFKMLRRAVCAEMQLAGVPAPRSLNFAPHVTLAYQETRIAPIDIPPIGWTVRELVLVKSLYGQGRHIHLARWPLQG